MLKVKFVEGVEFEVLVNKFEIEEDLYTGSGVYKVVIGSRGEVEEVVLVSNSNEFVLKEFDELVEEMFSDEEEVIEEMKGDEYINEFVSSGKDEEDGVEFYYECLGEEYSREYYYVK